MRLSGAGMSLTIKETEMKLYAAARVCLAVLLSEGAALGQQSSPTPAAPSEQLSEQSTEKKEPTPPPKHKLGPLEISVNWRTRAEGWYWFEGKTGENDYGLWDSLLRVGIGQTADRFDWFIEGEQPSILGLPNGAVVAAPQGQLGLGGNYYAANDHTNVANGFVKQAFVDFKHRGPVALKLGRFEYFDGLDVKPQDPLLGTVIQTRISSRLISNFAFTAVQRSFDGVQLSANSGQNNFTFFGARPTQGVFQVKGIGRTGCGHLLWRLHPVGKDHGRARANCASLPWATLITARLVLKTDNRPAPVRAADSGQD